MISGQQSTMAGMAEAYRTPDGALHLPLLHHASGELMGWQTRMPGKSPRYSTGVKSREAAPFIAQRPTSPEFAIITEGPTDAIAASQCAKIGNNVAVYGCWSSSTIPPKEWWEKNLLGTTVIVAGDGDAAGRVFNQRVADMVGAVYVARIPDGEDVRSLIETRGEDLFMATLMNALIRPAIKRSKSRKPVVKRQEFATLAGIDIISLVESAGGKRKSKLSTGGYKYLCPLHDDRNDPSLTVDPAAGSWYCWAGCGGGGPAQFVMAWRRCDYRDAVRWLESVHA